MEKIEDKKKDYLKIVTEYEQRSYFEGIKTDEIPQIKEVLLNIKNLYKKCDEYQKLKKILDDLYIINCLNKYHTVRRPYDFVENNALISSLIFANNQSPKIKIRHNNESVFICQFHQQTKPTMRVSQFRNSFCCLSCNTQGNVINYLGKKESLSLPETLNLLGRIFYLNFPKQNYSVNKDLLHFYQSALLSDEYLNFVLSQEREYYEHMDKYSELERTAIELSIDRTYETIERVKRREGKDFEKRENRNLTLIYELPKKESLS